MPRAFASVLLACAGACVTACGVEDTGATASPSDLTSGGDVRADAAEREELVLGTYNLEFFGSPSSGPVDDALQVRNASAVISHLDPDVIGLQEIVDDARFDELRRSLPGYEGLLVTDPSVRDGAGAYATIPYRLGVLYRAENVTLRGAKAVLGIDPGRAPLEVTLSVRTAGVTLELVFIVVHFYPFAEPESHARRVESGDRLKQYLDAAHPNDKVAVVGDWNDDVDESTVPGYPTPYAQLVNDPAHYRFTTDGLSVARQATTVGLPVDDRPSPRIERAGGPLSQLDRNHHGHLQKDRSACRWTRPSGVVSLKAPA